MCFKPRPRIQRLMGWPGDTQAVQLRFYIEWLDIGWNLERINKSLLRYWMETLWTTTMISEPDIVETGPGVRRPAHRDLPIVNGRKRKLVCRGRIQSCKFASE